VGEQENLEIPDMHGQMRMIRLDTETGMVPVESECKKKNNTWFILEKSIKGAPPAKKHKRGDTAPEKHHAVASRNDNIWTLNLRAAV
jgi:hypothetical protein